MHPELFAKPDNANQSSTSFGSEFPAWAKKGDVFVRVDALPNKVYKYDGTKWIEVRKEQSDTYLHNQKYIKYLVLFGLLWEIVRLTVLNLSGLIYIIHICN